MPVTLSASRVVQLRRQKQWTQENLAEKASVDTRTIQRIESGGGVRVRFETARCLAEALGVTPEDLAAQDVLPGSSKELEAPAGSLGPREAVVKAPVAIALPLRRVESDFLGREDEIRRMRNLIRGEGGKVGLSALRGMGGVGKTSLAVKVAHEVKDHFPDGQLELDLQGISDLPVTVAQAMARIVRGFRPDIVQLPDAEADLLPIYRRVLADKRALILLDNAKDEEQVMHLISVPAPVGFILTSRNALELDGVESIRLDVLPPSEALQLLRGIVGEKGTSHELQLVARFCGRLPLALRVAGTFLHLRQDWSVSQYIEELKQENRRLTTLKRSATGKDVEAVLALSARELVRCDPDLAERWQMLSVFPGDFGEYAAAAVWGLTAEGKLDNAAAKAQLSVLLLRSLIHFDANTNGYYLHDLMRPIAEDVFGIVRGHPRGSGSAERLQTAKRRHAERFLAVLASTASLYSAGPDSVLDGLATFDRDAHNIRRGQVWAAEHSTEDKVAADLCRAYAVVAGGVIDLRLSARERIAWYEAALRPCRQSHDKQAEGAVLLSLGNAHAALGEYLEAIRFHQQHLAIARELQDKREEAAALNNLGVVNREKGEPQEAISHYQRALVIYRELEDRQAEARILTNIGVAHLHLGNANAAVEHHLQALPITQELGDLLAEGHAWCNLGDAQAASGESRTALGSYEKALIITKRIGDDWEHGESAWGKAQSLRELGKSADAIMAATEALTIFEVIEHPKADEVRRRLAEWRDSGSSGYTI
jgi:tetratricopeptide (TPR) repeat protein/transcriptional regulator with XRE-family HTH domain